MENSKYEEVRDKIYTLAIRVFKDWEEEPKETLTPEMTDKYLVFFSTYSAYMEEEYGVLTIAEAKAWEGLRKLYKTVSETERAWTSTEDGLKQLDLKYKIKATDKLIAALKSRLKRFNNEAFNKY